MHPAPPTSTGSTDPRVYLDRLSGNWRYEDDEGDEWEWQPLPQLSRPAVNLGETEDDSAQASSSTSATRPPAGHWVKVLDDELVRAQQAAYSVEGVDESAPANAVLRRTKKRQRTASPSSSSGNQAAKPLPPSKRPKPVTSLYVTGLPLDATADEIAKVFSRYGVLLEDDHGKPRVKMYHDDATGVFKGEALVVYFKAESVDLAITMLDDTSLRAAIGQSSTSGPVMRVKRAEFPTSSSSTSTGPPSRNNAHAQKESVNGAQQTSGQRRHLSDQERKKIAKRVAKLESKLNDWRDDSDQDTPVADGTSTLGVGTQEGGGGGGGRTVVLTKMFTLFELEQEPSLLLDLKEDVREECATKLGETPHVTLWDKEAEGIITLRFKSSHTANECVNMMKGRFFAQRRIDAWSIATKPRFKKSSTTTNQHDSDNNDNDDKEEAHEQDRKHAFRDWLES